MFKPRSEKTREQGMYRAEEEHFKRKKFEPRAGLVCLRNNKESLKTGME